MKVELDLSAEDIVKEIVAVSESVYPGDPMPPRIVVSIALQRAADSIIKDLERGKLKP